MKPLYLIGLSMLAGVALGAIAVQGLNAQQAPDPRIADIVQAGKLRVGLGLGAPATVIKDPKTGELRGPALDLSRALAARMGLELQPVIYPRPGAVFEGAKTNAWDVTFLVDSPDRVALVDATRPYMKTDYSYLVLPSSKIQNVVDADRPGVRIATPRGDSSDLHLTRTLKRAELVRTDTFAAAVELLRAGKADAVAASRGNLVALEDELPGSRVLKDGFGAVFFAGLVPKGHPGRLEYLSEFIEEAKASGLVKQAIERAGLRGLQVVPPGKSN